MNELLNSCQLGHKSKFMIMNIDIFMNFFQTTSLFSFYSLNYPPKIVIIYMKKCCVLTRIFECNYTSVSKNYPRHRQWSQTMDCWNGINSNRSITNGIHVAPHGEWQEDFTEQAFKKQNAFIIVLLFNINIYII